MGGSFHIGGDVDAVHDAAQFGQALQPADQRIAGVDPVLGRGRRPADARGRGASACASRRGPPPGGAAARPEAARYTAGMSVEPPRWSASWNDPSGFAGDVAQVGEVDARARTRGPSPVRSLSRACRRSRCRRSARSSGVSAAAKMRRTSAAVETTRGRPNSGTAGSSGWMQRLTPQLLGHRHDLRAGSGPDCARRSSGDPVIFGQRPAGSPRGRTSPRWREGRRSGCARCGRSRPRPALPSRASASASRAAE